MIRFLLILCCIYLAGCENKKPVELKQLRVVGVVYKEETYTRYSNVSKLEYCKLYMANPNTNNEVYTTKIYLRDIEECKDRFDIKKIINKDLPFVIYDDGTVDMTIAPCYMEF